MSHFECMLLPDIRVPPWRASQAFGLLHYKACHRIYVSEILQCLKKYGQRLDLEIAQEMGVPLATVRQRLSRLAATGEIVTCNLSRFEHGKRIDAVQCRVSGYFPPAAPGRRAKPTA